MKLIFKLKSVDFFETRFLTFLNLFYKKTPIGHLKRSIFLSLTKKYLHITISLYFFLIKKAREKIIYPQNPQQKRLPEQRVTLNDDPPYWKEEYGPYFRTILLFLTKLRCG